MPTFDLSEFSNQKTALVLSGGVVKAAAWHVGVALALEELGFTLKNNQSTSSKYEIGTYVGSSAGALIGLYFTCGYQPQEIIDSILNKTKASSRLDPVTYKDMLSFKKRMKKPPKSSLYDPLDGLPGVLKGFLRPLIGMSGFFTTSGLNKYIKRSVINSESFEDYAADFFVIATQLDHSRKVIFSRYHYPNPTHDPTANYYTGIPISEAVTASMAVPPFYSPYPIENPYNNQVDYYIDGEIRETLSTHVAIDNSCKYIISSWTHTPYHYHDEIGSLVNYGLPAICIQSLYLMIQKKIISSRSKRYAAEDIMHTVDQYMKDEKFSQTHRKKILSILERKLHYKKDVKLIDIYPRHKDYQLFFRNSFSLNPDKASELVSGGYKRTMEVFKRREWER